MTGAYMPSFSHSNSWRANAACRGADSRQFFVSASGNLATPLTHLEQARCDDVIERYCGACPVLAACRAGAFAESDHVTIRGGMTPQQRRKWARGRRTKATSAFASLRDGQDPMAVGQ